MQAERNAKSDWINHVIKCEQSKAGGFQNQADQQRRNRITSTRSHHRSQKRPPGDHAE
jgi:hypothetical protein